MKSMDEEIYKTVIMCNHADTDSIMTALVMGEAESQPATSFGELLLLIPFTKFAHALYRIVALYAGALKPLPEREPLDAGGAD